MFLRKTNTSQKGDESSCRKLYHSVVRNATTLIPSIAMAELPMDIRNTSADDAIISLPPTARGRERGKLSENTPRAPSAEKPPFYTTITTCIPTIVAVIKSVIIPSLFRREPVSKFLQ